MLLAMWLLGIGIIFFTITQVFGEEGLVISRQPTDISVPEGKSARFECMAQSVNPDLDIKYAWHRNGQVLTNTSRRYQHVDNNGSVLVVTRADRVLDPGQYSCVATDEDNQLTATSKPVTLEVLWLGEPVSVHLQSPSEEGALREGDDVTLRCHVDGTGEIKIDWFRNSERVTHSERVSMRSRRLHISAATAKDNGAYRCVARSEAGRSESPHAYALRVPSEKSARLIQSPTSQIIQLGHSVRFDCVFENADLVEWYRGAISEPVDNSSRVNVLTNRSLLITDIKEDDKGLYTCVGLRRVSDEIPQSYSARLSIATIESPSVEPPGSSRRVVTANQSYDISCLPPTSSLPPARVYWRAPNHHPVSDTGRRRSEDGRLIFDNIEPGLDQGVYQCISENIAGEKHINITLIVASPPIILEDPETQIVDEETTVKMQCKIQATPEITTVQWFKSDHPIPMRTVDSTSFENGIATLTIPGAQVEDRGYYVCEATTEGFESVRSQPATLNIIEKLKFSPRPVNKKLELGSTSKVYCKALASISPLIRWSKEGENEHTFPDHIQDINGTLHFNGVRSEDRGKYTCRASTDEEEIEATIEIDVLVAPKFRVLPENPTEAIEGFPIVLHCAADGDPKPTIKWDRNSNFSGFDQKRFRILENGSLLVNETHLSDAGRYGCTAGNAGGFKRYEVTLLVRADDGIRPLESEDTASADPDGPLMTKTVVITLSAAAAYMVLVIGLMLWCRHRRRRRKQAYLQANTDPAKAEAGEQTELKERRSGKKGSNTSNGGRRTSRGNGEVKSDAGSGHSQNSGQSKRSGRGGSSLAFNRSDLNSLVSLGKGEFGEISLAKARSNEGQEESVVLVKALQHPRDDIALQEFRRQQEMLTKLKHANVVRLIGLCQEQEPHYMILEYTEWGDLKQFLIASRSETTTNKIRPTPLTETQILNLALQASRGLEHITDQRFVHRDVAARNCLIASDFTLKLTWAAPCRDTYAREYCSHRNQYIPARWLPAEAVFDDDYSVKSDIYSFACLVWELFAQGELPFVEMTDEQVLERLEKRELIWQAHAAAVPDLAKLQAECWSLNPRDRPLFKQVVETLEKLAASDLQQS